MSERNLHSLTPNQITKINDILGKYHDLLIEVDTGSWRAGGHDAHTMLRLDRFKRKFFRSASDQRALDAICEMDFMERMQGFTSGDRYTEIYFQKCIDSYTHPKHYNAILRSDGVEAVSMRTIGEMLFKVRCLLVKWVQDYRPNYERNPTFGPGQNANGSESTSEVSKYLRASGIGDFAVPARAKPYLFNKIKHDRLLRLHAKRLGRNALRKLGMPVTGKTALHMGFAAMTHGRVDECLFRAVPKDNQKSRGIVMASLGLQVAETPVASGVLDVLDRVGNFLENDARGFDGQHYHRKLLQFAGVSTLDFSNASDSNLLGLVRVLLGGTRLLRDIEAVRPAVITFESGASILSPIVAPMGFRICFVTMTLILAALACVLSGEERINRDDPQSPQVYGDDVEISVQHAERFLYWAGIFGYTPNKGKSFLSGPVKESCGGYFINNKYCRSYDITPVSNLGEYVAVCNKVALNAIEELKEGTSWFSFWIDMWNELEGVAQDVQRGPIPPRYEDLDRSYTEENLPMYMIDLNFKSKPTTKGLSGWLSDRLQQTLHVVHVPVATLTHARGKRPLERYTFDLLRLKNRNEVFDTRIGTESWSLEQHFVDVAGNLVGSVRYWRAMRGRIIAIQNREQVKAYLTALRAPIGVPEWDCQSLADVYRLHT